MRLVIDLDDTISIHRNRDYENAIPIPATIEKMRKLKQDGWEIIIYSSRGQNSCKGDIELIEKNNREQVETWLSNHDVPYDRLVFGKPLGDVYVDDKGIGLNDFWAAEYVNLGGNSGEPVYRVGDRVIKQCRDSRKQTDWYNTARDIGIKVPNVNSVVLDKIDIQYLDGVGGEQRKLNKYDLSKIISQIMLMALNKRNVVFDRNAYKDFAYERLKIADQQDNFSRLFSYIDSVDSEIEKCISFCHGDLSLSNVIFVGDDVYLIDPSGRTEFCSFLMDFAKLRFSLDGGEELLHNMERHPEWDERLKELSDVLESNGWLKMVIAMETVHWIRMLKYFPGHENEIIRKAKELEEKL